jgi:RimJ/RimL family protein N-acetyltransferase
MVFKNMKHFDVSYTLRDGTNVSIRNLKETDYTKLWGMCSTLGDETLSQLPPLNEGLVRRWCEYADDERSIQAVASVRGAGGERIVGRAVLTAGGGPTANHRAEFGVLVHDDFQDLGLGTELTGLMVEQAREAGLIKVYLEVYPDNERAIHVYEKLGFRREGVIRSHYLFDGELKDVVYMGVLL